MAENSKKPRGKPFPKGKTGNPGGRPKLPEDVRHVRELARQYTEQAIETLAKVMRSSKSDSAKVAAVNTILERGWGKAPQPVTGEEGGPVEVVGRIELVGMSAKRPS